MGRSIGGTHEKAENKRKASPVKFTESGKMRSRKSVNTSTTITAENTAHLRASAVKPNAR